MEGVAKLSKELLKIISLRLLPKIEILIIIITINLTRFNNKI